MHDAVLVHLLETGEQAEHEGFDFFGGEETIGLLDFVEELAPGQQFEDDVDGVVGFVDGLEFEQVGVVLETELAHEGELVNQAVFAVFGVETALF